MRLWKWQPGRQKNSHYEKFPLWYFRIWKWGFDAYIIRYPKDTYLGLHKDIVPDGEHHRLNITLSGYAPLFIDNKGSIFSRVILFRPDLHAHSVYAYKKTVKLSFGFVKYY